MAAVTAEVPDDAELWVAVTAKFPPAFSTSLAFPEIALAPGEFRVVQAAFHGHYFRGETIAAAEDARTAAASTGVRIVEVWVGTKPQVVKVSGAGWSATEALTPRKYDTCAPGEDVTLWLRNDSTRPVRWRGRIEGQAVKVDAEEPK